MDVVIVRWPAQEERRAHARIAGRPRLLLLEGGTSPPVLDDDLEDWIRVPADEIDLHARMRALEVRARRRAPKPELDGDGVLRCGEAWVALPPVEARLTGALLERLGAVVSRDALGRAGWPDGAPGRNALDVHVLRMRRRLSSVGLSIRTVRSRGYLLEPSDTGQQDVKEA